MMFQLLTWLFIQSLAQAGTATVTDPSFQTTHMPQNELVKMAMDHHHKRQYCGGFVASLSGETFETPSLPKLDFFPSYTIDRMSLVESLTAQVSEARLLSSIEWFSSYPTRFYTTDSGVRAMKDLAVKWKGLLKHLNYAKVELYHHKDWPQPSVIVSIQGESDELIVVGGHGDSINTDINKPMAPAPGADDNASGISVVTEVLQVLAANSYRPKHTLKFMAYAAEEVGLMGSMEITGQYDSEKKKNKRCYSI